jgi:heme-degrading monooxygenase HmoA
VDAWSSFAKWTARNQPGAGAGYLLRDANKPQQFISFGPWDNTEAIKAWRELAEFKAFVSKARELCDDFQPRSLFVVADSNGGR